MNTQAAIESPRRFGKNMSTFITFIADVNKGLRVVLHGKNYICMDRKSYEAELKQAELLGYKRGRLSAHDEYRILLSELSEKKEHIFSPNRSFPEVCTICGNFEFNSVHMEDKNTE